MTNANETLSETAQRMHREAMELCDKAIMLATAGKLTESKQVYGHALCKEEGAASMMESEAERDATYTRCAVTLLLSAMNIATKCGKPGQARILKDRAYRLGRSRGL